MITGNNKTLSAHDCDDLEWTEAFEAHGLAFVNEI